MSQWSDTPLAPPNAIFNLSARFKTDPSPSKLNLGVGAYRDGEGRPYTFNCVRRAEQFISDKQASGEMNHEYLPIRGDLEFVACCQALALGAESPAIAAKRVAGCQGISGTGALRLAGEFFAKHGGAPTVMLSSPTWGNHGTIFKAAGLETSSYSYFSAETNGVDFAAMSADVGAAAPGTVVLLHSCCHNPTGADLSEAQWGELADIIKERKLVPLFDTAYQGFASGDVDEDAFPIRSFVARGIEVVICQSFSKNMGLYNERAGCVNLVTASPEVARAVESQLALIVRHMYSNPPAHGAQVAKTILGDPASNAAWRVELKTVCDRIRSMRVMLVAELKRLNVPGTWDHVTNQRGMFCFSGLNKAQSTRMVDNHHIYMLSNGRINCAALKAQDIPVLAAAIKEVVSQSSL